MRYYKTERPRSLQEKLKILEWRRNWGPGGRYDSPVMAYAHPNPERPLQRAKRLDGL